MNKNGKQLVKTGIFLAGIGILCASSRVSAAENPTYTITKGKKATISTIIRKNPLTSSNQNKYKNLTWKSGNKKIVKIIGNKKIKGVKKGKVYIRGYNSKKKKVLAIRVTVGKKVSKINVKSTTVNMYVGDKAALNAAAAPASASNKKLFYSSSNPAVDKVSKNGRVTAVLSGISVITIQSKYGHAVNHSFQ